MKAPVSPQCFIRPQSKALNHLYCKDAVSWWTLCSVTDFLTISLCCICVSICVSICDKIKGLGLVWFICLELGLVWFICFQTDANRSGVWSYEWSGCLTHWYLSDKRSLISLCVPPHHTHTWNRITLRLDKDTLVLSRLLLFMKIWEGGDVNSEAHHEIQTVFMGLSYIQWGDALWWTNYTWTMRIYLQPLPWLGFTETLNQVLCHYFKWSNYSRLSSWFHTCINWLVTFFQYFIFLILLLLSLFYF